MERLLATTKMKTKKEIIKYLIVTPFIGATDFGVYYLLIHFRLPYSVAKAISYIIANGAGYLFNKFWILYLTVKMFITENLEGLIRHRSTFRSSPIF